MLNERNKRQFKKGEIYYIVSNFDDGPVKTKYQIKEVSIGYVFAIVDDGECKKVYKSTMDDFITEQEADELFEKYKNTPKRKRYEGYSGPNERYCFNCKNEILPSIDIKCDKCFGYICPTCGACFCDDSRFSK